MLAVGVGRSSCLGRGEAVRPVRAKPSAAHTQTQPPRFTPQRTFPPLVSRPIPWPSSPPPPPPPPLVRPVPQQPLIAPPTMTDKRTPRARRAQLIGCSPACAPDARGEASVRPPLPHRRQRAGRRHHRRRRRRILQEEQTLARPPRPGLTNPHPPVTDV